MRKQIKIKAFIALSLLAAFFFSLTGIAFGAQVTPPSNLVVLGDSLSSGQTPFGVEKSFSYGNALQSLLDDAGVAGTYDNFGKSGMDTEDLLTLLYNPNSKAVKKIAASGENGIVTISIGANDVLPLLIAHFSNEPSPIIPTISEIQAYFQSVVCVRISLIIAKVKEINPSARIYILGFYDAIVNYLSAESDFAFKTYVLPGVNDYLQYVVMTSGANFVPLVDVVTPEMLPGDIHPNKTGYRAIGAAIFSLISLPS